MFLCNGREPTIMFDGTSFTRPTMTVDGTAGKAMPKSCAITAMPKDDVVFWCGFEGPNDGPGGAPSNPSMLFTSQFGDPMSCKALDYVNLRVGDGDKIMGATAWREFTFVFKQRAYWIFTGQMTSSGITTYYRRPVDTGIGLIARHACVSGRDGVYFVGPEGVYRTTGGEPELLSELIAPIFTGAPSPYYTGGTINRAAAEKIRIAYFDEKVYVYVPVGDATDTNRVLVYDTQAKSWTIWAKRIGAAAPFDDPTRGRRLVHAVVTDSSFQLQRLEESARTDEFSDFLGFWRGGFLDFSDQTVKTMVENKLWGHGLLSVRVGGDYEFGSRGSPSLTCGRARSIAGATALTPTRSVGPGRQQ